MTISEQQPEQTEHESVGAPTFSQQLEQYNRETLDHVRKCLPAAALELKAAGVARIEIRYDGVGDSGQIEEIQYYTADGTSLDPDGKVSLSEDGLMDLF